MTTSPEVCEQILAIELDPTSDFGAVTIRGALFMLLAKVWEEESDFSGKRPFGNSSWQYDFSEALINANIVGEGEDDDAIRMIGDTIKHLAANGR